MQKCDRTKSGKRKKELFVERFGGKCQMCGFSGCIDAFDFHHIDENKKEHSPSKIIHEGSIERAERELEKCILVCANCHRTIHSEDYNYDIDISKFIINWLELECNFCHKKFNTKISHQKFCSVVCSKMSQRKIKIRPNKDELKELIENYSWTALGKMFSVTDNAVRKWAKGYSLI